MIEAQDCLLLLNNITELTEKRTILIKRNNGGILKWLALKPGSPLVPPRFPCFKFDFFFFPKYEKNNFVVNINWQYFLLYNMNYTHNENTIFEEVMFFLFLCMVVIKKNWGVNVCSLLWTTKCPSMVRLCLLNTLFYLWIKKQKHRKILRQPMAKSNTFVTYSFLNNAY